MLLEVAMRSVPFSLLLLCCVSQAVEAQRVDESTNVTESVRSEGTRAGSVAADRVSTSDSFIKGLFGGALIGIGGSLFRADVASPSVPLLVATPGTVLLVSSMQSPSQDGITTPTIDPPDTAYFRNPEFLEHARQAYVIRLQERHREATLLGGVTGVAIGILATKVVFSWIPGG
jgi:hypothetical protein